MQFTSQGVSTYQHMSMFDAMDERISQKVKPESFKECHFYVLVFGDVKISSV